MKRDEARKLLGGYATGSLTEYERKLLFDAALDDQDLFDELAAEQALKELIESPGARTRLQAALEPKAKARVWWPWAVAFVAAATVVFLVVRVPRSEPEPVDVAQVQNEVTRPDIAPPAPAEAKQATDAVRSAPAEPQALRKTEAPPSGGALAAAVAPAAPAPPAVRAAEAEMAPVPDQLNVQKQALPMLMPQLADQAKTAVRSNFLAAGPPPVRYEFLANGNLRITPGIALRTLEVRVGQNILYTGAPGADLTPIEIAIPAGITQVRIQYALGTEAPTVLDVPVQR